MQTTVVILKPDGIELNLEGELLKRITSHELEIVRRRTLLFTEDLLKTFYPHRKDEVWFPRYAKYMMRQTCIIMIIKGENAISKMRIIAGDTSPKKADPNSLRGQFGIENDKGVENVLHASSSTKDVVRETNLFFSPTTMEETMRFTLINLMFSKFISALDILKSCCGQQGVWADPTRYRDTCWTRDFGLAIQPSLLQIGNKDMAKRHLTTLSAVQRDNGQIPILFLDNEERWLDMKTDEERKKNKVPFMLRRYREGELWNLTPGTRDSEIIYTISMYEYANETGDVNFLEANQHRIDRALEYITTHLMKDGLVTGADWRDTMEKELGDKTLLTNNCLLYHAYDLMGMTAKATELKERIHATHFQDGSFIDYLGSDRFDPLGASFAVLYDVADGDVYPQLERSFRSIDTPSGVTIKCRHNPYTPEEVSIIDRTEGVVVWPFVVGFTILALLKMDYNDFAAEQFEKLVYLDGFREWYDPETGKGYGAQEQLWSATLYMRAMKAME